MQVLITNQSIITDDAWKRPYHNSGVKIQDGGGLFLLSVLSRGLVIFAET
jgi:hypothetical protein